MRRPRVLIVDDQPLFREMLKALLEADPRLEVVGATGGGASAVEQTNELAPDVVLMDIAMPDMDGIEATRRIRAAHPEVAVVILTGSNAIADRDRASAAGAARYVTKSRLDVIADIILRAG